MIGILIFLVVVGWIYNRGRIGKNNLLIKIAVGLMSFLIGVNLATALAFYIAGFVPITEELYTGMRLVLTIGFVWPIYIFLRNRALPPTRTNTESTTLDADLMDNKPGS